jgi:hypothetical protein
MNELNSKLDSLNSEKLYLETNLRDVTIIKDKFRDDLNNTIDNKNRMDRDKIAL